MMALDQLGLPELVDAIVDGQANLTTTISGSRDRICAAVDLLVDRFGSGGRILLVGAGTSGRLAAMEAAELPGTFGVSADRVRARLACARHSDLTSSDAAEDDVQLASEDMAELDPRSTDILVAVAASGRTPYTLRAAEIAARSGCAIVSLTTMPGSPLATLANVAVELDIGPEVLDGSTRLASGTAQKIVLNTLTTAAMVRLGHVHDRYMVDVVPANQKLLERVIGIVARSSDVPTAVAATALEECSDNLRAAIVRLLTGVRPAVALDVAGSYRTVREAIAAAHRSQSDVS